MYDPRERQFVGFESVTERRDGTSKAPGEIRTTTFGTAVCGSCVNNVDYSLFHALRGLPVLTEERTSEWVHLRTVVNEYWLKRVYPGLDGRLASLRHLRQMHTYLWDGESPTLGSFPIFASVDGSPTVTATLPSGGTELRLQSTHDILGNETAVVDFGKYGIDTPILTQRRWTASFAQSNASASWSFRPYDVKISYSDESGIQIIGPLREYTYDYDAFGRLQNAYSAISGSLALPGPSGQSRAAGQPAAATANGSVITLAHLSYDNFGNIRQIDQPNGRCTVLTYDTLFSQFAASFATGCGSTSLVTAITYPQRKLFTRESIRATRIRQDHRLLGLQPAVEGIERRRRPRSDEERLGRRHQLHVRRRHSSHHQQLRRAGSK
jgi:hypothetical protein